MSNKYRPTVHAGDDRQDVMLSGLLDPSAEFEMCHSHTAVVRRTWHHNTSPDQVRVHVSTQQVFYAGGLSIVTSLAFGVPRGSVAVPVVHC